MPSSLPTYLHTYSTIFIRIHMHTYPYICIYTYIYMYILCIFTCLYVHDYINQYIYNVNAFVNSADLYIFKHKSCIWTHYCRTISSRILLVRNQAPVKKHLFGILHIFGSLQIWFSIGWTLRSAKHHRSPSPNEKIADEQCSSLKVGQPKKGK